jgi:hypothetical protein
VSNASLGTTALAVLAGLVLSAGIPLVSYLLLTATSRLDGVNVAAIAAHYGSISVVTFIGASDAGLALGFAAAGFMVAVAAAMEAPAIFSGLMLAGKREDSGERRRGILAEVAVNGSIVLLIGAFVSSRFKADEHSHVGRLQGRLTPRRAAAEVISTEGAISCASRQCSPR